MSQFDNKSNVELPVEIKRRVGTHDRGLSCTGTPTPQKPCHGPNGVKRVDTAEAGHPSTAGFAIHLIQGGIHVEQQLAIG